MFIKELYIYNKALCIFFLLFITVFVFVNYKQGAVAAPVYQYGMFSEKFHIKDTQTVYSVFLNGKPADLAGLNFPRRDMVLVPPENYQRSKGINQTVFLSMKNIAGRINLSKFLKPEKFANNISDSLYFQWYKGMIRSITNSSTENIEVFTQKYIWDMHSLKPVSLPAKILYFGSY